MDRIIFLVIISTSILLGCANPAEKELIPTEEEQIEKRADTIASNKIEVDSVSVEEVPVPKILIVPCSNGYEYHMRAGVVNTSLQKYLAQDERIEVLSFPYVELNGAGYFGVYDKRHCMDILKHTKADFLVMTRMIGGLEPIILQEPGDAENQNWGYSTKILNCEKMEQFNGISAKNLANFEEIDTNVKRKASILVDSMLSSHK